MPASPSRTRESKSRREFHDKQVLASAPVPDLQERAPPVTQATKRPEPARNTRAPARPARNAVAAPHSQQWTVYTPKYNDVKTAVILQDREAVTQLLELGWWVDKPDLSGYTPLMEAVNSGDVPMAELLLKSGADPNVRGYWPLKVARHNKDAGMEDMLLHYGAK